MEYLQEMQEPLFESSTIQTIDPQRRLPFEVISEGVFGGAYGRVDKKGISPFYFNTLNENQNHQVRKLSDTPEPPLTIAGQICRLQNIPSLKSLR
jgi:hypothetical protein